MYNPHNRIPQRLTEAYTRGTPAKSKAPQALQDPMGITQNRKAFKNNCGWRSGSQDAAPAKVSKRPPATAAIRSPKWLQRD